MPYGRAPLASTTGCSRPSTRCTPKTDWISLDIAAGPGNDVGVAGGGADRMDGGRGRDRLSGDGGNDRIDGDRGDDRIDATGGRDRVFGGNGDDRIDAEDGKRDRVDCGHGSDTVIADRKDRLERCERKRGAAGKRSAGRR
jgi:hypothetical protein